MKILTRSKNESIIVTTPKGEEIIIVVTETSTTHVNLAVDVPQDFIVGIKNELLKWAYET